MKKKLAKIALAGMIVCTIATFSICDVEAGTFEVWLIQQFVC
jgi:hypothetical protein